VWQYVALHRGVADSEYPEGLMAKAKTDLDEIIKSNAEQFAKTLRTAAKAAKTEADIRSAADRELSRIEGLAKISLKVRHEFTVASGRIDSVYDRVVIEYKNPNSPTDKIGANLKSAGSAKLLNQIKSRFADLETDLGHPINSLFGAGIDGHRFIFVRYRDRAWVEEEPVEISAESATRFLWALFNLGQYLVLDQVGFSGNPDNRVLDPACGSGIHRRYDQ
jgi:hypothetical protein